jgi:phosphonatase-like hydrolase
MTLPALVIFDMAGTTVEDRGQVPSAFAATLAANNITITADEITRVRGASKRQAIRDLLQASDPGACLDEASSRSRADRIYAQFRENLAAAYRNGGARAVPGAEAVIRDLRKKGVKVALTTGFDRDIATLLLATIGWTRQTIDVVVCGDDVANGRPAPDMILLAMKLTAVEDPALVANLGDTTLDLESAARAGVRWNIGVLTGAHTREALSKAPHTEIIQSVADLRF